MSEIRQVGPNHWVGPEDFGITPNFHITQHGVEHYPNGHLIQQEPLNPGNKKIPIVHRRKDAEDMGEFMGLVFLFTLIWIGLKGWGFIDGLSWSDTYVIDLIYLALIGVTIAVGLFKPIAMPVRFHKQNQEVYVWHDKVLYRIPWQECEISVIVAKTHMGYGRLKDGYELMLWLNPKHAVNAD
ncbi:hypothetical protein DA100_20005, partial [Vibrio sp. Hep-1b-8]